MAKYESVLFKSLFATLIADRMGRHIFSCFIKPKNSGNEGEDTREFKTKRMMTKRYNETCTSYKMKLVGTFDCSDSVATGPWWHRGGRRREDARRPRPTTSPSTASGSLPPWLQNTCINGGWIVFNRFGFLSELSMTLWYLMLQSIKTMLATTAKARVLVKCLDNTKYH